MGIGAAIAGSLAGGLAQGSAARRAANAQVAAANAQIEEQRAAREQMRGDLSPWREGGGIGFQAYLSELGLGEAPMIGGTLPTIEEITTGGAPGGIMAPTGGVNLPTAAGLMGGSPGSRLGTGATTPGGRPTTSFRVNGRDFATRAEAEAFANANRIGGQRFGGFQQTQDYLFGLNQGLDAVQASAAARGGLLSGATLRDMNVFGQNFASTRRNEFLNRLAGLSDAGQNAAGMSGQASMAGAAGISNALSNMGNAQAAGAIGTGNAINGGITNALSLLGYQQALGGGQGGGGGTGTLGLPRPF